LAFLAEPFFFADFFFAGAPEAALLAALLALPVPELAEPVRAVALFDPALLPALESADFFLLLPFFFFPFALPFLLELFPFLLFNTADCCCCCCCGGCCGG